MAGASIEWSGDDGVIRAMQAYEQKVYEAVRRIAQYWSPVVEAYAKDEAAWVDRTGNARQGLQGLVEDLSETMVAITLKGGVDYQIWLELKPRYAIILPTLEAHYGEVSRMLKDVFS